MSEIIKYFPRYFVVYAFVSGTLILLFSTLVNILPTLINPFAQTTPTEALSSTALFGLLALTTGFLTIPLSSYIVGNCSLNSYLGLIKRGIWNFLRRRLKNKVNEKKDEPEEPMISGIKMNIWFAKVGVGKYIVDLYIKIATVNGIIIGAELAFLTNLVTPLFDTSLIIPNFICLIVISLGLLILGVSYNKFKLKPDVREAEKDILKNYKEWEKHN